MKIFDEQDTVMGEQHEPEAVEGIKVKAERGLVVGDLPNLRGRQCVPEDQVVGRVESEEQVAGFLDPPV